MEEKKTKFNYLSELFTTFGVMVVIFACHIMLLGDLAHGYSTIFDYGREAFGISTLVQLFALAVIICAGRNLFFTDVLIKNLSMIARSSLFFVMIMVTIMLFVIFFGWFPVGDIYAWVGFLISFAICSVAAVLISRAREKTENEKMNSALEKYKDGK